MIRDAFLFVVCFLIVWLFAAATGHAQTLPDDSSAYHLVTVTGDVPSPAGVALLDAINTNPRLVAIAAKCKRFDWKPSDDIYKARYAESMPPTQLPIVALIRSDGGVIYKASGTNVPAGDALADALVARAYVDRQSNPRPIAGVIRPDAEMQSMFPARNPDRNRPFVIPDTVTVEHGVGNAGGIGIAIGVGVLLLLFAAGGGVFLVFVACIAYAFTR